MTPQQLNQKKINKFKGIGNSNSDEDTTVKKIR